MTGKIEELLIEDIGVEEVTTNAIVPAEHRSGTKIVAEAAMKNGSQPRRAFHQIGKDKKD